MPSLPRLPALQSLLVQLAAFVLMWLLATAIGALAPIEPTLLVAAFLQGGIAAALAWRLGMPRWWLVIHLLFAPALVLLLALRLPSWIFLLLFALMLPLYWQTFYTRVPYYPSSRAVRDAVAGLLPSRPLCVIDIGSGFGGLVLDLAQRRPDCRLFGVELAPLPWCVSLLRARLSGRRAHFLFGDYARLDFARYDLIFAYLSPAAMPALWDKARTEMRPGALLLSYEFTIPDVPPALVLHPGGRGPVLYGWHF